MQRGPIWLVGMMGAGKSAVGALLATALGRPFVDTDLEIEREAGSSVAEIFESEGERSFRARERAAIDALCARDAVVALGGGAIAEAGVAELLARAGIVVYLSATPHTLLARVGDAETRPLLANLAPTARLAKLEALLALRAPAYESAAIAVATDGRAPEAVAAEIRRRLESVERANGSAREEPARA